jgi:type II secretory pathway pseudopilin PulG
LKLKRIFVVLAAVAVVVATAAVPAMARNTDKAANKAAKQAQEQAQKAATAGGASSNVAPASEGTQKVLPRSGGMPAGNIALLGPVSLLAGGGILLYKKSAVS